MVQYTCPSCRTTFGVGAPLPEATCPSCGFRFQPAVNTQNQQPPYGQPGAAPGMQPPYGQPYQQPYYQQPRQPGVFDEGPSGKSRGLAGLLAILLGGFGVHYFYIGKIAGGFICILLNLVTCGIWCIVTLIQGIMMMCMRQDEFERKYMNPNSTFPLF